MKARMHFRRDREISKTGAEKNKKAQFQLVFHLLWSLLAFLFLCRCLTSLWNSSETLLSLFSLVCLVWLLFIVVLAACFLRYYLLVFLRCICSLFSLIARLSFFFAPCFRFTHALSVCIPLICQIATFFSPSLSLFLCSHVFGHQNLVFFILALLSCLFVCYQHFQRSFLYSWLNSCRFWAALMAPQNGNARDRNTRSHHNHFFLIH